MTTIHKFALAAGFVALSGVAALVAAPALPEQLVTHWNAAGEPDGTMPKTLALALIPVFSAVLLALFAVLPRIDPRRESFGEFRSSYDWFVIVFVGYMLLVHAGIIAFNLGYEFDFALLLLAAVAGLFYCLGVLLTRAKRNWFVGVRTPWTLSSEAVWDRTHELAGRLFKLTALLALVGLLFDEYAVYFLVVPALLIAAITVVYSYYLYERIERDTDPSRNPDL